MISAAWLIGAGQTSQKARQASRLLAWYNKEDATAVKVQ